MKLILFWFGLKISVSVIIVNQAAIFKTTEAKLYLSIPILSTKDNWTIKKYNFQITINWNRYQFKVTTQA